MSRLKEIRLSRKYNQDDIAKLLNVGRTTYTKYENGQSDLPTSSWVTLAKFYNVTVGYLIGEENVPNQNHQLFDEQGSSDSTNDSQGKERNANFAELSSEENLLLLSEIEKLSEKDKDTISALIKHMVSQNKKGDWE